MRRRRRRNQAEVELNLAAMLDMAFPLLTFFIVTFKPCPIEGQVTLRLPPPQPVTNVKGQAAGSDTGNLNPVAGLNSLVLSVIASPSGTISAMAIGEGPVANLAQLESKLKSVLSDPGNPSDQVIIQVDSDLRYEEL